LGEYPADARDVVGVEGVEVGEPQAVLREGAGLVRADHVHPGQAFDRGKFLHQALLLAEPDDADREGQRGEQDEPLGHHRHQRAGHPQHHLLPGLVGALAPLHPDSGDADRDQQPGDQPQDLVDALLQFGLHQ
jgi:hypothetical protein